jgi:DNA-directed RNA polymerase specialized sigma24 family protein
MRRDDHIDFFVVQDGHLAIHRRLEAWASWVRVRPHGWQVAPMFRQYRSKAWQWHEKVLSTPPNIPEALEVERAVSVLPEKHRTAIRWCYVMGGGPLRVARDLGVSKGGLLDLIHVGRQMLVNRLRQ